MKQLGEHQGETNGQMAIYNREEADTRIVVHILHALEQGMKIIKMPTVDTRCCKYPRRHIHVLQASHDSTSG